MLLLNTIPLVTPCVTFLKTVVLILYFIDMLDNFSEILEGDRGLLVYKHDLA